MASERNTARKLYAEIPQPKKVRGPVAVPKKHRREEADTMSIPYCIFLAAACILTLVLGAYYLQQQALSTSSQKKIALLEEELAEMKKENTDDLNRIETSINLEEIRDIALNELGMVYATQDNVVLYKKTDRNYVSQHEELPQEEKSLTDRLKKAK